MTGRERFRETMRRGTPDRVPLFEDGLREDVLQRWRREGLAEDADLSEMFWADRRERIPVDIEPRPRLEGPVVSRPDVEALRERLDPEDPERFPADWAERVEAWRRRDHVLELQLGRGFFLSVGVGDWRTFLPVMYALADRPAVVKDTMKLCGEFAARIAERVLQDVEVDCVIFSEPIGGNDRPLLSPRTYEEFVVPSYRPALEAAKRHGVETVVFVTYANARALLPCVLEAGFNCLWACEVNTEAMDYRDIRREFGRDLRLIGGIDLDVLALVKEAIRREVTGKVPPLLAGGGYVPLADGRVRSNVPFDSYVYYRRLLEQVTQK